MSDNKKNESVIYRCPNCLGTLVDVTVFPDQDGVYRCFKCGFNGNYDDLMQRYAEFRARYKYMNRRITLEEQQKM